MARTLASPFLFSTNAIVSVIFMESSLETAIQFMPRSALRRAATVQADSALSQYSRNLPEQSRQ
jgi:hypothetical protein